jgi:hypothetical protein
MGLVLKRASQAVRRASSTYVNQFGGSSQSGVTTNGPLFGACMNAQGWYLQDERQQQARAQASKDGWAALIQEAGQLCEREDLQPHYNKTPCQAQAATLEQMTDKSRITPSEKEALSKLRGEYAAISKRMNEYVRQADPRHGNSLARVRERSSAELDKVTVDFYEGRITRGEYNKKRREIAERSDEQWRVAQAN